MKTHRLILVAFVTTLIVGLLPLGSAASAPPAQAACGPGVTYTVRFGDTLFSIARAFGTTVSALQQANGIVNPNLVFAGETLNVPCAALPGAPVVVVPPPGGGVPVFPPGSVPPFLGVCDGLRLASPRGGLAYGVNTFYVDPIPGATSYLIRVFNEDVTPGRLVAVFETPGNFTRVDGDVSIPNAGPGFFFSVEVQALNNGVVICSTPRLRMQREAAPDPGFVGGDDPEATPDPAP